MKWSMRWFSTCCAVVACLSSLGAGNWQVALPWFIVTLYAFDSARQSAP